MMTRNEWLQARTRCVTSTDQASILGLPDAWQTALHVYREKAPMDAPALVVEDESPSPHMRAGILLEPLIADLYLERRAGLTYEPLEPWTLFYHPDYPQIGTSLDRKLSDGRIGEFKTVGSWEGWGDEGTDETPHHILLQAQHQMMVTGRDLCEVAALHRGTLELRIYPVPAKPKLLTFLAMTALTFWELVEKRQPPDPDYENPETVKLLQALKPVEGLTVDLPREAELWASAWKEEGASSRDADKRREVAKAHLLSLLGPAEVGLLPDGRRIKRKIINVAGGYRQPHTQDRLTITEK